MKNIVEFALLIADLYRSFSGIFSVYHSVILQMLVRRGRVHDNGSFV